MSCPDIVNDVVLKIKSIKGVRQVLVLNDEAKQKVFDLEKEAEHELLMGLGLGDNVGVKEALKRDVVVICATDREFEWPLVSYIVVEWRGKVIGEQICDPEKLKELKKSKNVSFMGSIALYKERMPKPELMIQEKPKVIISPMPCFEVEKVLGVCNVVMGSPSISADKYQKTILGVDFRILDSDYNLPLASRGLGTMVIGFDLKK